MSINLFAIIASFGGGIIGATLGALPAITLWGLIVLYASVASVVTGNQDIFATIAFNPAFGPQVVYGGAIGSLTYAWKKGVVPSGLDILKPLASFNRADVMISLHDALPIWNLWRSWLLNIGSCCTLAHG